MQFSDVRLQLPKVIVRVLELRREIRCRFASAVYSCLGLLVEVG